MDESSRLALRPDAPIGQLVAYKPQIDRARNAVVGVDLALAGQSAFIELRDARASALARPLRRFSGRGSGAGSPAVVGHYQITAMAI